MPNVISLIKDRFRPFRHPEFRSFYFAQAISLIGNWMQDLAKSWIILNMIGKALAMGALMFAAVIPPLLLGSYGGNLADRKSIKSIFMVTQLALSTLAFALGIVVSTGHIQMWHLLVFAFMEGIVIAFDMLVFSKITLTLVPREDFQ
jgi:MFS family permease